MKGALITVRCDCGETRYAAYPEQWVCEKCGRHGRYRVATLVETIGLDGKHTDWLSSLKSDCPRYQARNFSDMCGAHSPDMVDLFCRDEKAHS